MQLKSGALLNMSKLQDRPKLGMIRAVTHSVASLQRVEDAYSNWLGYHTVWRGTVSSESAKIWGTPAMEGLAAIIMAPAQGEKVFLRFIEDPAPHGWHALCTYGWNATEIVVRDVDALAGSLTNSPFKIIGPPAGLQRFPMIRAMQVIGPEGECLYFTQVGDGSGLDLAQADSFVGRVFIVVAGGPDLPALYRTYDPFDNVQDKPVATKVKVISLANNLPLDTEHAHGLIRLSRGTLIELDHYPSVTTQRATQPGHLPPGMNIVSFDISGPQEPAGKFSLTPAWLPTIPAARVRTVTGAVGEMIELIHHPLGEP